MEPLKHTKDQRADHPALAESNKSAHQLIVDQKHKLLVDRVIAHIGTNKDIFLDRDAAARLAMMSPQHFSKVFFKITGVTYSDYLFPLLVARVRELLADPMLSIKFISATVGFKSANYFSSWCRNVFGLTPTEYRAAHSSPAYQIREDLPKSEMKPIGAALTFH